MKRIAYYCRTSIAVFFCLFEFISFASADNSPMVPFVDLCDDTEPNMTRCGPQEVLDINPVWNKRNSSASPPGCHGNRSCSFHSQLTCKEEPTTEIQYLKVDYSCNKITDATSLRLNDTEREVTGNKIDLLSPNFPCEIPEREFDISCSIKLAKPEEDASYPAIDAIVMLVRFENGTERCDQKLRLSDGSIKICSRRGKTQALCRLDPSFFNNSWETVYERRLRLRYRNKSGRSGKFWIQLQAIEDITVTCKQSPSEQDDDFDNDDDDADDDDDDDITSDTPTTSELPSTQPANFEDDDNEDGAEDTDSEVDEASAIVANEDDSSGNSVPAVVGGVVGGLVLIAAVAAAIFCLKRRPKKGQESSAAETPASDGPKVALQPTAPLYEVVQDEKLSPRKQNPVAYDNVVPIENESETVKVEQSSPKRVKPGAYDNLLPLENKHVYSDLDINGKTETTQALDDHTIMVENDELYTTRDVVPGGSTHDVNDYVDVKNDVDEYAVVNKDIRKPDDVKETDGITQNATLSHTDEDEVIMRENNDLYEAATTAQEAGDKKTNNKEAENDDDSTIMFENNELYTSSVDLAEDGQELSKLPGSNRRMSFA